ncbi:MAG: BREX-3 system P-loop-containing protein BrxF [Deferrisomatales bacterium]
MPSEAVERLLEQVAAAEPLYHRLVLVVSPSGGGKTTVLRAAGERLGAPLLNVNLSLSEALLDLTERQRALRVPQLLGALVQGQPGEVVLLDNLELLFAEVLQQDPLRLLEGLSRNKTLVAAWGGSLGSGQLTYATPGHPEHRKYPAEGFLSVALPSSTAH